jgi:hypothetical protein
VRGYRVQVLCLRGALGCSRVARDDRVRKGLALCCGEERVLQGRHWWMLEIRTRGIDCSRVARVGAGNLCKEIGCSRVGARNLCKEIGYLATLAAGALRFAVVLQRRTKNSNHHDGDSAFFFCTEAWGAGREAPPCAQERPTIAAAFTCCWTPMLYRELQTSLYCFTNNAVQVGEKR